MSSVEIRKNSWLNFADSLEFEGTTFWETPEFPKIVPQDGDIFLDVTDQNLGKLDLIAFDVYGDPDLWWVIALANNIDLIPTDMVIGTKIRIPEKSFVNSLIAKGGQK